MKYSCFFFFILLLSTLGQAQDKTFTRADSLRGGLRPERTDFDMLKYDLSVEVIPEEKFIKGHHTITFKVLEKSKKMQLDLFENMEVDSILFNNKKLKYHRDHNAVFIYFPEKLKKNSTQNLTFYYSGNPQTAKKPPWDGGFVFKTDRRRKDWVSVAVQGTGASLWYPNKDTQSDRPEEAEIHITTPKGLMGISNGKLTNTEELEDGRSVWSWKVTYPINNYNITLNVGEFEHFSDSYEGIELEYYVKQNMTSRAKRQFKDVKKMLKCFREKFGEYPFKNDSYKLIETPYLGMEHQSGISYGNRYRRGYDGKDLSKTRIGLKWDFIIIHESAHEWFGNSIVAKDITDMWIHEAFASYAESVFVECEWGKEEAHTYLKGLRQTVESDQPIVGNYGVNNQGSNDMYYKGANFLHTLRSIINDDEQWWKLIKDFYQHFKYKVVTGKEVINFFDQHTEEDIKPIFEQYLYYVNIPQLQFKVDEKQLYYRWEAEAVHFEMPVDVVIDDKKERLKPSKYWQKYKGKSDMSNIEPDTDQFYIKVKKFK